MKHRNATRKAMFSSVISLLLCISMLIGTTFAWFTDTVTSGNNTIASGNLDVELYHSNATVTDRRVDASTKLFMDMQGKPMLWEPGAVSYENLRIANEGDLALTYQLLINTANENHVVDDSGAQYGLSQILKVGVVENGITATDRAGVLASVADSNWTTLENFLRSGSLLPEGAGESEKTWGIVIYWEPGAFDNHWNLNNGKQLDQGEYLMISLGVQLIATQERHESDAFGDDYDTNAKTDEFPVFVSSGSVSATVTPNEQNQVAADVVMTTGQVTASIPAGVQLVDGTTELTMTVEEMDESGANLTLGESEAIRSLDVHIDGIDASNTVPMTIVLGEVLPVGLNSTSIKLYHVEKGTSNVMTPVYTAAEVDAHNEFYYEPATGHVVVAMASFSEVACVIDTVNAWEGEFDYSWYNITDTSFTIANAEQLAGFGAIVGGMAATVKDKNGSCVENADSFSGKTINLAADINLGDKENENENLIFHPIGYSYVNGDSTVYSFEGTFDGQGHTIANFYQNTWEIKGDYGAGYYKDAMGLFGYVYNGTVENLTVDHFSSDGEFTPTGVVAAYADGNATFANIAITNCNPRVYNTGNGGIIGIAGDTGAVNDDHITLKNITVDNSNKISALWGSYDVACGGLVGMYRGNVDRSGNPTGDTISFENCHVAAQIDVYNDVCANYQYYAYRYAGMIIGSVRHNEAKEGKTIPAMAGISASGCTVNYGDWNDYYYCEFEKNGHPSYSGPDDYKFSRIPHSELNFTDSNGNGVVDVDERASVTGCKHNHSDVENNSAIYLPFHQLFTGYSWGVSSIGLEKYGGIVTNLDITEGDQQESVEKFKTKFTGDFLYRVGNQNTVSLGSLFAAIDEEKRPINASGVVVTIDKVNESANVSGSYTPNTTDWTKGTIQFSGTGVVKVTIQDYNFCTPTVLYLEVIDATNLTSATGTTTGGTFVLVSDVNTSTYVNYWNCTLYGNGFTYSLKGAPTTYNSKQGKGIIITQNAVLDNIVIIGDVYNGYGAFTENDYYNTAIDVRGDTTIQNCYIANCSAPVRARNNVTIINSTLYGGAVANLIIESNTTTLENVTTINYDDGREVVGMGIVVHSDATESAKLVLNGKLTQYNFLNESNVPTNTFAKNLHDAMFGESMSEYHFGTRPNRYVNTGIISLADTFNGEKIEDNANTGYAGSGVTVSSYNGYVYTQLNTSGTVNNSAGEYKPTTQGTVPPSYSFDYTNKNYVAKADGSNDYCYYENGAVNISMDEGDTFNWDTSILTIGKGITSYTVTMQGTDYTGKSIAFNTAGEYTVLYTYTDDNNSKIDENGNITTYSVTYTKEVKIVVAVAEAATKHAEFTFGSSNTASTTVTVGNSTYVMPNVTGTSSTIGSTMVSGQTIYYPIVEIIMSDGKTSHTSGWYAYFPVFSGVVTITDYADNGTGDKMTPYNGSTTAMPGSLSVVGDPATLFKYQSGSNAGKAPVVKNNVLVYSSAKIEAKRSEYNTVVQYSYTDNAGATYYYYVGYHAPSQSYTNTCVTADTLITLADGSQVRVDSLTGDEMLLVWNHATGKLESAPVAYIVDHEKVVRQNKIAQLFFADGTDIKIIGEHVFYDASLNKYVTLTTENAHEFVGHRFVNLNANGEALQQVNLTGVKVFYEETTTYEVVSYEHLTCFTNGVLSASAYMDKLLNIFDITEETMAYDAESVQRDIEKYGLYTYADFEGLISEEAFEMYNAKYLKIAVGKGYIDWDDILALIDIFINVNVQPLQ